MIPNDVHGCGNSMEFYDMLIRELPSGSSLVEVGVFYGRGLVYLAQNSNFDIWGVDQFIHAAMPYHLPGVSNDLEFYQNCRRNLNENGASRVSLVPFASEMAALQFSNRSLDCVFLDAAHDYDSVKADIAAWRTKVKPGGYLAGDDYIDPWLGVIDAVTEAFPEHNVTGQTWWVRL